MCPYSTGHQLSLKFAVPAAGTYSLSVVLMSDYWIGTDAKWPLKFKVLKRSKEIMAARAAKEAAADGKMVKEAKEKDGEDKGSGSEGEDNSEGEEEGEGADSDDGTGRHGDDDYPSEETGTEESSDEEEVRLTR